MNQDTILKAVKHILYQAVYVLFVLPYHLWCNAIDRLARQNEKELLKFTKIKSEWPMFTFLKRWLLDFFFDLAIAVAWIVGLYLFFKLEIYRSFEIDFKTGLKFCSLAIYGVYVSVAVISWTHDLLVLLLKPLKKYFSWCTKPAQHLDLTIDGGANRGESFQAAAPKAACVEPVIIPQNELNEPTEETTDSKIELPNLKPYIIPVCVIAALLGLAIYWLSSKNESQGSTESVEVEESASAALPPTEPAAPRMPTTYEFPYYNGYSVGEQMANLITENGFAGTVDGMTLQEQFDRWNATSMGSELSQVKANDEGYTYQFFFNNTDGRLSGIALSHYADDPEYECSIIDAKLGTNDIDRVAAIPENGAMVSPGYTRDKVYIYYFYSCAPSPGPAPRR